MKRPKTPTDAMAAETRNFDRIGEPPRRGEGVRLSIIRAPQGLTSGIGRLALICRCLYALVSVAGFRAGGASSTRREANPSMFMVSVDVKTATRHALGSFIRIRTRHPAAGR